VVSTGSQDTLLSRPVNLPAATAHVEGDQWD